MAEVAGGDDCADENAVAGEDTRRTRGPNRVRENSIQGAIATPYVIVASHSGWWAGLWPEADIGLADNEVQRGVSAIVFLSFASPDCNVINCRQL